MKQVIQLALRLYQRCISPMLPHSCRFVPTCSEYAMEAIERHGVVRGSWLAASRLLRCRPFARAGFDPVPQVVKPHRAKVISPARERCYETAAVNCWVVKMYPLGDEISREAGVEERRDEVRRGRQPPSKYEIMASRRAATRFSFHPRAGRKVQLG